MRGFYSVHRLGQHSYRILLPGGRGRAYNCGPSAHVEGHTHARLRTVQLHVVDVPAGEGVGVRLQVAHDARVAGASEVAVVLIDAEFQAEAVNLDIEWIFPFRISVFSRFSFTSLRSQRAP